MKNLRKYRIYQSTHILRFIFLLGFFTLTVSCSNSLDMQAQKNKEIVKKSFEVVGDGDFEGMEAYIAANYIRHCQATPDLVIESLDAFKEFIRKDRETFPDQKLDVEMLVAEGDLVAFWGTYKVPQMHQMRAAFPPAYLVDLDFSGVHRLENGKVVETWVTWDNVTVLTQLGQFPPKLVE